jgi:cell division protein FtsB
MYLSHGIRRWARTVVAPACGIALTGYFSYNLVIGERGFLAWRRLSAELQAENAQLSALQAKKRDLARRVSDLSPDHLDPDLLDERVRATLNLVAPNELVIMRDAPAH